MAAMSTAVATPSAPPFSEEAAAAGRLSGRLRTALRHGTDLAVAAAAVPLAGTGLVLDIALVLGWAVVAGLSGAASPLDGAGAVARRALRGAAVLGLVCWVAGGTLAPGHEPAGLIAYTAAAAAGSLLCGLALLPRRGVRREPVRTLVVGTPQEAATLAAELGTRSAGQLQPAGSCTPDELEAVLVDTAPDAVLAVPSPGFAGRQIQRTGWQLEKHRVPLLVSTRLTDVAPARGRLLRAGTLGVLQVEAAPRRGALCWAKEIWERSAALLMLVALLPLLLTVAAAVRLDSPGPALFRQTRVGRNGRPFTMLKFRTMTQDAPDRVDDLRAADEGSGVLFKLRRDPRITGVGGLLRRYSVDELPQLVNVVRGEMSLVGPRPALPEEVAAYDHDPRRRLAVKPGLTGLWQVSGRSDLPWDETVRLDLDYVDNWSLGRDLTILARTVRAVVSHDGAY